MKRNLILFFLTFALQADESSLWTLSQIINHSNFGLNLKLVNLNTNYVLSPTLGIHKALKSKDNFKIYYYGSIFQEPIIQFDKIPIWNKDSVHTIYGGSSYLGVKFSKIFFYAGYEKEETPNNVILFGGNIFSNKSILLKMKESFPHKSKEFSLSILSGTELKLGFELSKKFHQAQEEYSLGFSISTQIGKNELGYILDNSNESHSLFWNHKFETEQHDKTWIANFENEKNHLIEIDREKKDEKKIVTHDVFPKVEKKKEIIYKKEKFEKKIIPFNLDELLKDKIQISIALKAIKASKAKKEYDEFILSLPTDLKKKINYLQYQKQLKEVKK